MRVRVSPSAPDTARLAAWVAAAGLGVLALSQVTGRSTRTLAVAQSLTPHAAVVLLPSALATGWRRAPSAAGLATVSGAALGALAAPLASGDGPGPRPGGPGYRVAAANLLFTNRHALAAADALLTHDPDIVVFVEYTAAHHRELRGHALADRLPRCVKAFDRGPRGLAVWSRYPVEAADRSGSGPGLTVTVAGPAGDVPVVAVHTTTPIKSAPRWRHDLATVGAEAARVGPRALVIGDFNAAYWHPPFRRLLRDGLVDAHLAHGRPLSSSWPAGGRIPRFVRLDHALTGPGLVATRVDDLDVPGSDHRGVVVTVAPTR